MKTVLSAALALVAGTATAIACDDHAGRCEIEDWSHKYTAPMKMLMIDGVATCDEGEIRLRLYDGEGEGRTFLGVERAFIEGHIFKALVIDVAKPASLSIKYSIEPE